MVYNRVLSRRWSSFGSKWISWSAVAKPTRLDGSISLATSLWVTVLLLHASGEFLSLISCRTFLIFEHGFVTE
jgi:hypothetical protein